MMEPGGCGAGAIGSLIDDIYIPSDECEEVLDEFIDTLIKEDPKLRNGRRKMFFDKVIEKDLVPLVKFCADNDLIARAIRLLANLSQPLEVFIQLGLPLGMQCQREIAALVVSAKSSCVDIDFFKSLHARIVAVLGKGGKIQAADSEMINHCLLLMRNLLHVGTPVANDNPQPTHTSITLQSMLSSFFLSQMDKMMLRLLNHPQKVDWVVSVVQLLSLVFKDYAGTLLDGDAEESDRDSDTESDEDEISEIVEFIPPSQTSKFLAKDFRTQLNICSNAILENSQGKVSDGKDSRAEGERESSSPTPHDVGKEKMMQMNSDDDAFWSSADRSPSFESREGKGSGDGRKTLTKMSSDEGLGESMTMSGSRSSDRKKSDTKSSLSPTSSLEQDELMSMSDGSDGKVKAGSPYDLQRQGSQGEGDREESMVMGDERRGSDKVTAKDMATFVWDSMQRHLETEKEIMSEMLSGSCLMDLDIIVSYLKQFASEIVCSGLSNLVRSLMKVLMSTHVGVLDDSFFMWTVGFFLSYARHAHIEFAKYREIVNLDVFGFLVYQGFRNCETLVIQHHKQENCALTKYRLHLVVCTLNQMFQVILDNWKDESLAEGRYLDTLQRCLAQMGDLQRLFILLIHAHQSPPQDFVYLRDLVHTNHIYLLLLENWATRGYTPRRFSMLLHVQQFATVEVMRKYGNLLEEYSNNSEMMNVAVMTMMYHVAGDCNRGDVLLQLPILKKFSEIWGDDTCTKHVEFNDLIEFVLENFMTLAFKDPVRCAQKLFDLSALEVDTGEQEGIAAKPEKRLSAELSQLSEEDQDLLFTWTTDLQGSVNVVDDLINRLHNRGSCATRQQVMLHLLRNGLLEEKQLKALTEEMKELNEVGSTAKPDNESIELPDLDADQLLPYLLEKIKMAGFGEQLVWLQEQLLEAAYVHLGVRNSRYRIHVEEPLARFYALQDKSIPLVMVNDAQGCVVKDPYFTVLLQSLGLFPADTERFFFCRIPHFLTPAELLHKAQLLGPIPADVLKFDANEVQEDLSFTEFTPLFKDNRDADMHKESAPTANFKKPVRDQGHQWLNFVCHVNKSRQTSN